jgi:hypothetical protein
MAGRRGSNEHTCWHKWAGPTGCPECGQSWGEVTESWEANGFPESYAPGGWDPQ